MGRMGSTTSVRARQMRRVLAHWQRSGLTLREFGEKRGIPLSTLSWWRQVFRRAGDEDGTGVAAEHPVVFTEVRLPTNVPRTSAVLDIVARGATDLRRSFDRLSAQVQEVLRQDPLSGHMFVFFNRPRNRVKLLVWERDGFWLLYKRLEAGTFAALERDEINARELYLLLEGIEVVRERRRYTRLSVDV